MTIVRTLEDLSTALCGRHFLATMGFFDGVHLGHRRLIEELAVRAASEGKKSVILALDRPFSSAVRPDLPFAPGLLTSLSQKIELLAALPGDLLFVIPFTKEVALMTLRDFTVPLIRMGMTGMILGYDNRFGSNAAALPFPDFDRRLRDLGLTADRIPRFVAEGIPVSSSAVRELVRGGDFETAAVLLGRPFSIRGTVRPGRRIGHTIDYPTANIFPEEPQTLLPRDGVFVSLVRTGEGQGTTYPAMSYYGSSPTVAGAEGEKRIEAHLFDFDGNLYGLPAEISFLHRLRGDIRFPSLEALRDRLAIDREEALAYFRRLAVSGFPKVGGQSERSEI